MKIIISFFFVSLFSGTSQRKFICPLNSGYLIQVDDSYYRSQKNSRNYLKFRSNGDRAVKAIGPGTISKSLQIDGLYIVALKSGNFSVFYENVDSAIVKEKQTVQQGQIIGYVKEDTLEISFSKDGKSLERPSEYFDCKCN